MKVNVFNDFSIPAALDVLTHHNNQFILAVKKKLSFKIGDNITVAKKKDNTIYFYDAQVQKLENNQLSASYKIFDSATNVRKHPRELVTAPVDFHFSNGTSIHSELIDVSEFGAKIKTNTEFPRITGKFICDDTTVQKIFGSNVRVKIVWRKNLDGAYVYGLQKIAC